MLRRLAFAGVRVYRLTADETIEGDDFRKGRGSFPRTRSSRRWRAKCSTFRRTRKSASRRAVRSTSPTTTPGGRCRSRWACARSTSSAAVRRRAPAHEARRRPCRRENQPSPYTSVKNSDAQPFDTAPGIGFDPEPMAKAIVPLAGRIAGSGAALAVNPAENNAFKAINRAWKAGASVRFDRGRYVISGLNEAAQPRWSTRWRSRPSALPSRRRIAETPPWPVPRQHQHGRGLDALGPGAGRIPVHSRLGADIQAGSLRDRIDVLVITTSLRASSGWRPRRPRWWGWRSAGGQRRQGCRDRGVRPRRRHARLFQPQRRVCDRRLKLPVKDVTTGLTRQSFFAGTSLLNVAVDASQRVMAGMPERAAMFFSSSPASNLSRDSAGPCWRAIRSQECSLQASCWGSRLARR